MEHPKENGLVHMKKLSIALYFVIRSIFGHVLVKISKENSIGNPKENCPVEVKKLSILSWYEIQSLILIKECY